MDGETPEEAEARRPAPAGRLIGRGGRSDGQRSYRAIMEVAPGLATERGLDGLSINELAAATGMSKAGLYAPFTTKEELQLAIVEAAADSTRRITKPTPCRNPFISVLPAPFKRV